MLVKLPNTCPMGKPKHRCATQADPNQRPVSFHDRNTPHGTNGLSIISHHLSRTACHHQKTVVRGKLPGLVAGWEEAAWIQKEPKWALVNAQTNWLRQARMLQKNVLFNGPYHGQLGTTSGKMTKSRNPTTSMNAWHVPSMSLF